MGKQEVKPDWRIVKVEQIGMCDKGWVAKTKLTGIGVFYLIDANLHVHICSLTPSLEAWPMQGYATFETDEACEADEGEAEMEALNSEEACSYFDVNILDNPSRPATKYADIPEQEEGEDDMVYRRRVADEVRECVCGNAIWFDGPEEEEEAIACWTPGCYLAVDDHGTCTTHGAPKES